MKAELKNFRQPPRKVRLVADYIRGKNLKQAIAELDFIGKKSAEAFKQLLQSAAANAKNNFNKEEDKLVIETVRVDKGLVMRRYMPRARGRATPLRHRTSHIKVELAEK